MIRDSLDDQGPKEISNMKYVSKILYVESNPIYFVKGHDSKLRMSNFDPIRFKMIQK
jgi:hypothetical protein